MTALLLVAGVAVAPGAVATHEDNLTYSANAFGTAAFYGTTFKSGKTAPVSFGGGGGCKGSAAPVEPTVHRTGQVASLDTPFLDTGVIFTTADATTTEPDGHLTKSMSTAETYGVNALSGLVTADVVKATSITSHDPATGFDTSGGADFVNLQVNGVTISDPVQPNTTIETPVATIVLNEQQGMEGPNGASFTNVAIHIYINDDDPELGVNRGDQIIVSYAHSAIKTFDASSSVQPRLGGAAYGTSAIGKVTVDGQTSTFRHDPTAPISLPCLGTDGEIKSNTVADVYVPDGSAPVISAEQVHTTAQGLVTASTAEGETTSTIEGLALLDPDGPEGSQPPRISADLVRAEAHISDNFTMPPPADVRDDLGSEFVNLVVCTTSTSCQTFSDPVPPNTTIDIGFAQVHLHRVIFESPRSIEVRMIEVVITDPTNPFNLDVNSVIRAAVAKVNVRK